MLQNLAIVIPTYNRSNFLNRALSFYSQTGFNGCLYIADGSNDLHSIMNKQIVNNYKGRIKYFYDPESINEVVRMAKLRDTITEKYVTFAGDDDYQLPIGLSYCVYFLNNNLDYDVCFGFKFNFEMEENRPKMTGLNMGHDWDYNSPSQRFLEYCMTGNSTNYSIHRKCIWDKMFNKIDIQMRYLGTEFLMCATTVISSRLKRIDRIVTLYEDSGLSWPHVKCETGCDPPPIFQLVHSYEWIDAVNEIRTYIVELLMEKEELTEYQATHIFNMGFMFRIYNMIEGQFIYKYGKEFTNAHKEFVKKANKERNEGRVIIFKEDIDFIKSIFNMDTSYLNIQ